MREGYLLIYIESNDEVHMNLITEEHYNRIIDAQKNGSCDDMVRLINEEEPIERFWMQTFCSSVIEPDLVWPYNDTKILGTVCLPMY